MHLRAGPVRRFGHPKLGAPRAAIPSASLSRMVLLLAAASACAGQTTSPLTPAEGIVYGTIRDMESRPQPGAVFEVVVFAERCTQLNPVLRGVPTETVDGTYRQLLRGPPFARLVACLVVNAQTPTGLHGTVRDSFLVLRPADLGPLDSVRVDVIVK